MIQEQSLADIQNVVQFVLEIDKLKAVLRKVKPIGETRYENTAEHSWQIAVFALSLVDTLGFAVDVSQVIAMLLAHDIGEIDAGDKFVFAQDGWEGRKAAELRAVERIFALAPEATGEGCQDAELVHLRDLLNVLTSVVVCVPPNFAATRQDTRWCRVSSMRTVSYR